MRPRTLNLAAIAAALSLARGSMSDVIATPPSARASVASPGRC